MNEKLTPALPMPRIDKAYFGRPAKAEYDDMVKFTKERDDHQVRMKFKDLYGEKHAKSVNLYGKHIGMVEMALHYYALLQGYQRTSTTISRKIIERYEACATLSKIKVKRVSEFLVADQEKGDNMSTSIKDRRSKERRKDRVTAASVLIPLLGGAKVPEDEDIIKKVKEETGSHNFNAKQLAWYKWKFRQGKLTGQDGTKQAIHQGSPLKAKASKNGHSKKKVVVKKKKAVAA